jgi:hypothetical protein
MALAGGAKRAIQLDLDAGSAQQQIVTAQPFDKANGSKHGTDGVGTGWADANLEQVENTQGHDQAPVFIV